MPARITNPHAARSAEISLGIRSARGLAIAKRAQAGTALDDADRAEVTALANALAQAANAVASKDQGGVKVRGRRNLASVGLALSTATRGEARVDPERAAEWLSEVASDLEKLANGEVLAKPDPVLGFLRALVDAANRSASGWSRSAAARGGTASSMSTATRSTREAATGRTVSTARSIGRR